MPRNPTMTDPAGKMCGKVTFPVCKWIRVWLSRHGDHADNSTNHRANRRVRLISGSKERKRRHACNYTHLASPGCGVRPHPPPPCSRGIAELFIIQRCWQRITQLLNCQNTFVHAVGDSTIKTSPIVSSECSSFLRNALVRTICILITSICHSYVVQLFFGRTKEEGIIPARYTYVYVIVWIFVNSLLYNFSSHSVDFQ